VRVLPYLIVSVTLAAACSDVGVGSLRVGPRQTPSATGDAGSPDGSTDVTLQSARDLYPTIGQLHELAISRTCALNNGVCHSSKEYPDIHSLSTLLQTVSQPCNLSVPDRAEVRDACEPEGDHLVIAASGFDAEIARIDLPAGADPVVRGLLNGNTIKLWFATSVTPLVIAEGEPLGNLTIRRPASGGDYNIALDTATATAMTADSVTLNLYGVSDAVRRFFDERFYPWEPSMARIADVNRNGVLGHARGISMLTPGDPMKSYLVLRLLDETEGDLMPRQCREWDDRATKALGCWIQGLEAGEGGTLVNALEPIDYDACTFEPEGKGRCTVATSVAVGSFEAVEDVIARTCGGAACHVGQTMPAAGMDLSPGKARASLIGVPSTQVPSMQRVVPGDPAASYLMCKLDPACATRAGQVMPLGGALQGADLEIFRAWIAAGAP
jgi:hypothetical protein